MLGGPQLGPAPMGPGTGAEFRSVLPVLGQCQAMQRAGIHPTDLGLDPVLGAQDLGVPPRVALLWPPSARLQSGAAAGTFRTAAAETQHPAQDGAQWWSPPSVSPALPSRPASAQRGGGSPALTCLHHLVTPSTQSERLLRAVPTFQTGGLWCGLPGGWNEEGRVWAQPGPS